MKKNGEKKKTQFRKRRKRLGFTEPPKIPLTLQYRHKFRFQSSSLGASGAPITNLDILGLLGVATSATGVSSIICSARLLSVEMWAPTATTSQVELDVQWKGFNYIKPTKFSDVAMDTTVPGHVLSKPPAKADAGQWMSFAAGTQTLCVIYGPVAVTVDLVVDFVLANAQQLGAFATYVSSGLTTGYLYFGCADKNTASPKLLPSGVIYYG